MKNTNAILIFKTNIEIETDKTAIRELLDALAIEKWNIDTDDSDCVLRVVSGQVSPSKILKIITETGYFCQELD